MESRDPTAAGSARAALASAATLVDTARSATATAAEAKVLASPRQTATAEVVLSQAAPVLPREDVRAALYAAIRRIARSGSDPRRADELLAITRRCFGVSDRDEE